MNLQVGQWLLVDKEASIYYEHGVKVGEAEALAFHHGKYPSTAEGELSEHSNISRYVEFTLLFVFVMIRDPATCRLRAPNQTELKMLNTDELPANAHRVSVPFFGGTTAAGMFDRLNTPCTLTGS
jgi:hypothetical protein